MEGLFERLIGASAALFLAGLLFLILSRNTYRSSGIAGFSSITNNRLVRAMINGFKPNQNSKKYSNLSSKLGRLPFTLTVEEFYLLKMVTAALVVLLSIAVMLSNYESSKSMIISDTQQTVSMMSPEEVTQPGQSLTSSELNSLYNLVSSKLTIAQLVSEGKMDAIGDIEKVISLNTNIKDSRLESVAEQLYGKITKVNSLNDGSWVITLTVILALGFLLPNLILFIAVRIRDRLFEAEVFNLETLVILLGGMENITVAYIISVLADNARLFRKTLNEFYHLYTANHASAFRFIEQENTHGGIKQIIDTLRMCEYSDKKSAIESIINKRNSRKDFNRMQQTTIIEQKDLICLVLYFVVFTMLMILFVSPWLSLVSFAGIMGSGQ